MAITPLPTPPSRDDPANFAARGDAFLGALPTFGTEANALANQVNSDAISAATNADSASASATNAQAASNAVKWVSGTTYQQGDGVWSPITLQTYRKNATGLSSIDPSIDVSNWTQISQFLSPATQAEMEAGSESNLRSMSPLRVRQNVLAVTEQLTGLLEQSFIASGNITAGKVVQFGSVANEVIQVTGTEVTYNTAKIAESGTVASTTKIYSVAFDPNSSTGLFAFIYYTGTSYYVRAGTLISGVVTIGTGVALSGSSTVANRFYTNKIMFDPVTAGKFMIIADDDSATTATVKAWIGNVSGTTITMQTGQPQTIVAGNFKCSFTYYAQDKFVALYVSTTTLFAIGGSISGGTITLGTAVSLTTTCLASSNYQAIDIDYDPLTSNRLLYAFCHSTNNDLYVGSLDINPTTFAITSYGSNGAINGTFTRAAIACDPLIARRFAATASGSGQATGKVCLGTAPSGSNPTDFTEYLSVTGVNYIGGIKPRFVTRGDGVTNSSVLVVAYINIDTTNAINDHYFNVGIINGSTSITPTTVTWGGAALIQGSSASDEVYNFNIVDSNLGIFPYTSDTRLIEFYRAGFVDITTNIDVTKIIGIANQTVTNGQTVKVNPWGSINKNQTGLTFNSTYYVNYLGNIVATSPSLGLSIGKALNATNILLKGLTV